ncbi:beta-hexosaminidase [Geomicrobium sp. JCM 19037]|nr:glycoside hydrolase family 3 protein [Geomicrobium sp. JCM 19037]GAK03975.1 beta-hexosaminidase [Geomicrobium sp. JCM 19037]
MNFAPTLDVNVNPANPVIGIRSFSEDPELVTDLGVAQIQGYQDQQVMATAKHFPGHGDTDVDSHYGLPIIEKDLETLFEEDIAPFKEAISAGVDAIMPAHIVVPALDDSGLPATLSKPILTDLLRDELGFTGLIVTDSLGMSGANVVPPERVPVEAIKAGVDLLLNPPNVELAYESVLEAVNSGEISESRLDESVSRIVQQKQDQGLFDDPYQHPDGLDVIGNDDHLSQATTIADKSITLVKNDNVLPLQMKDDVLVVGPNIANANMLEEHLNVRGFNTSIAHTADAPTEEDINAAADEAAAHDVVVIVTHSAHLSEQQQQLVTALHSVGKPVIVTAARNPYDVAEFPGVDAYIAAYGNRAISHEAVAKILTGEVNPQGLLPVTIPDHYEFGHGLSYHIDATYMKTFVSQLEKSGRLTDRTVIRTMNVHLSAVDHFEQQERSDKVVQHMNSFLQMIDMFTRSGQINEDVAQVLEAHASEVIESWEEG